MPASVCVAWIAVSEHGDLTTYGIVVEAGCRCGRELFVGEVHRESGVVSTCSCRDPLRKAVLRALEVAKELRCRSLKLLIETDTPARLAPDDLRRSDGISYLSVQRVPRGDAMLLAENALNTLISTFPELFHKPHNSGATELGAGGK